MITPEKAQRKTEVRWRGIVATGVAPVGCGWCEFGVEVSEQARGVKTACSFCPVVRSFGHSCVFVPEYRAWCEEGAGPVLDLVLSMREQFITLGYQILAEEGLQPPEDVL